MYRRQCILVLGNLLSGPRRWILVQMQDSVANFRPILTHGVMSGRDSYGYSGFFRDTLSMLACPGRCSLSAVRLVK